MPKELDVIFDPFLPVRDKVIRLWMIRVSVEYILGMRWLGLGGLG